ncbi:sensor histidine kinase [Pseudovibrio exalbescens]|uniref:sensor histidine kinase n=1 Tax=Pseudovibrio exalbescens TaxID=197461 RepID=UPI002366D3FD|nr:sensor histidine kinase [Pseudovibrio exalbescens]MDD7911438.1 sensor histidine kinase [Pseudovibrio exalbescens]
MMSLILLLTQQMCVYLVIVYLVSKTPFFKVLTEASPRLPHKVVIYIVFSGFGIMATYFGEQINDAIANTRVMGAIMGGLLGGPVTGFLVGLTAGIHRYSFGGFTDLACAISTTMEGLSAGLIAYYFRSIGLNALRFKPLFVFWFTVFMEMMQMAIILLVARPFDQALDLVLQIAPSMLIVNSIGTALFMSMVRDQKAMYDKLSSSFTNQAMRIAERCVGVLAKGFDEKSSAKVAQIIIEETKVGAVAITDRKKLLAFIGIGDDHHIPGRPISSQLTIDCMKYNRVMFADGVDFPYSCSLSWNCRLGSCLVIPLTSDSEVIGTIKLYEARNKMFLNINRTLGEGIAKLLSNQILYGQLEEKQHLLTQSELKLLQAQVNPHFLFNALNTIAIITRRDPENARKLLLQLSKYLRINLKRTTGLVSLCDELDHIDSYLNVEKARFSDRLEINFDIPNELHLVKLPAFTLQPIIENAVKHGISQMMGPGTVTVTGAQHDDVLELCVEDNAGLFQHKPQSEGLGLNLVDKRLKNQYGPEYGLEIECEPDVSTKVHIRLPMTVPEMA